MKKIAIVAVLLALALGSAAAQSPAEDEAAEGGADRGFLQIDSTAGGNAASGKAAEGSTKAARADAPVKIVTVSVDAARDAFFMRGFSGGFTERTSPGPYPYQGDGEIKAFQTSAFDDYLTVLIKGSYTDPDGDFGGLASLKVLNDSNKVPNASGVAFAVDWQAWLRPGGLFKISTGNQAERGSIPHYQNFDDFLKFRFDYLGILLPTWQRNPQNDPGNTVDASQFIYGYGATGQNRGYAEFAVTDTSDLYVPAGTTARQAGMLAEYALAPVTLTAAVGSLYESISWPVPTDWLSLYTTNSMLNHDSQYDPFVKTSINFAFRTESARIAGMVQAAAVYKLAGTTRTKQITGAAPLPGVTSIDEKTLNHSFGLYVNILPPVPGLGITAGYSGQVQIWENAETTDVPTAYEDEQISAEYKKALFPVYHGVDLRVQYTGIDKLTLTFNNNVSFSSISGTNKGGTKEELVHSWTYQPFINDTLRGADRSESYLGLYNALGLKYALTGTLSAHFQICNEMGIFTMEWEQPSIRSTTDNLGLYLGATYQILKKAGFHASLRGGFALKMRNFSWQDPTPNDLPTYTAGYYEIGIPLGVLVEY